MEDYLRELHCKAYKQSRKACHEHRELGEKLQQVNIRLL